MDWEKYILVRSHYMLYLEFIGLLIATLLIAFKINYFVYYLKHKEFGIKLNVLKTVVGWPIAIASGAVGLMMIYIYDLPGYYMQIYDLVLSLFVIAYIDAKEKTIPNILTIATLLSQLVTTLTLSKAYPNIWNIIISAIILFVLMFISKISNEQIGMGDVKLIAVINLIYGISFSIYSLLISLIIMLICVIPLLIAKKLKLKSEIPFAPFYSIGVSVYILLNLI